MDDIRDALLRMVKTTLFLRKMSDAYTTLGLDDNPHHQMYGNMCDAIYSLIGEHTEEFDKSVTYLAINAPILTDERRVELLMYEYDRNHPELPRPNTIDPETFHKMVKKNGGYKFNSPEGG